MKRTIALMGILLVGQSMRAQTANVLGAVAEADAVYATIKARSTFRKDLESLRAEFNAAKGAWQALLGIQLIGSMVGPIVKGVKILQTVTTGLSDDPVVGPNMKGAVAITAQIAALPWLVSSITHRAETALAALKPGQKIEAGCDGCAAPIAAG